MKKTINPWQHNAVVQHCNISMLTQKTETKNY